ncbi:MAG: PHP domain-containing protein [Bacilli bacterium]|nr:PHP domain-containing protein [Bacilli bacterium]
MANIIDLHIHTNCSDGELSPREIIDEAYNKKVGVIAISDHDTIDAYNDDLFEYADSKNIKIIPAVEISTKANRCGIHILGYNVDISNDELRQKLNSIKNIRRDYLYKVSKKLKEIGYDLNTSELENIEIVTKAHIALDVLNNIKNKELLLKEFNHIPTKGEFIESILIEGKKCFVEKKSLSPIEAANIIRQAKGKVVLAHPMAYTYEDELSDEEIISIIKEIKADGIEANYIYVNRNNEEIDDTEKWRKIAKELNLFTTVGSDFHNKDKVHPEIGLLGFLKLSNIEVDNILNNLN